MKQLVFVHGRAQEFKDAATLKGEWIAALRRGLAKSQLDLPIPETDVRFPYYGQTLWDLVAGDGSAAGVIIKGASADREEQEFMGLVVEEVRRRIGVTDDDVAAVADSEVVEMGPLNWGWVEAALRVIDERVPGSGLSLALFTKDVYQYLGNPGVRDKIEAGVREAVPRGVPTVVVGHSLGSVVSYCLLGREGQAHGWDVPLYVTVGSPLAVTAIKKRLAPIGHPKCVGRWFNARDKRDVVALYGLDDEHFPVDPRIENKTDVSNNTANRHGIAGYLDDADIAARIYNALMK